MHHVAIDAWLREDDPARLAELWAAADAARREEVGDAVHLRGLIECSNHCRRSCGYCGLRAGNRRLARYRLDDATIRACAREAQALGYGTVVLQAGEDPAFDRDRVADLVRAIKDDTGLAVTLSLGERDEDELVAWRVAGADRYLLRFETADPALYARIHPPAPGREAVDRQDLLRRLHGMGYEVGSGIMLGIPGQEIDDLARSIALFAELRLHMVGVGPYIPHPDTPLAAAPPGPVRGDVRTTCTVIALTRLTCPGVNIPATSALATIDPAGGREAALRSGGNVIMPNVTPARWRAAYAIYPDKACIGESARQCHGCMKARLRRIGRSVGRGPGAAPAYHRSREVRA